MQGDDSWLYGFRNLSWIFDDELAEQLPRSFQIMLRLFCWQRLLGAHYVHLGPLHFNLASSMFGRKSFPLRIGQLKVWLNAEDPRMLAVPGEIRELLSPSSPLKRELKIGDTFIDVGANHGSFSLAASEIVGKTGLVVAFEPQPILADLIKKTLSENDLAQEKVFQYACGNAEECRQIFVPRGSSGRASLFKGYTKGELVECSDIKLVKLDSALEGFDLPGNVLLKIDVEGSEMDALAGARETIARYHPFILMEMNAGAIEAAGTSADSFMDFLSGFGYTRFYRLQAPHERYPLAEIRSRASSKKDDIVVY